MRVYLPKNISINGLEIPESVPVFHICDMTEVVGTAVVKSDGNILNAEVKFTDGTEESSSIKYLILAANGTKNENSFRIENLSVQVKF